MRAAVCPRFGEPEVVEVREMPSPEPAQGQVRVKVAAAAVNFPDVLLVAGRYQIKVPPPFVPGSELAGEVVELGPGATGVEVGDRVSVTTMVGAFAEEVVAPVAGLAPIPTGIDARTAAAFGIAHRTAYHSLRSVAAVGPGEELVVLGAGGGVGLAAVQLGVLLGATVTAVASSAAKLEVAEACGATNLIDHTGGDLRQALRSTLPEGSDVVIDPVGGRLAEPALRSLRWGGRFVTVGYATGEIPAIPLNLVLLKGITVAGFEFLGFASRRAEEFRRNDRELTALFGEGRVVPHVGATFGLDDVAAALRLVADGRAVGKVVIDVAGA